MSWWTRSRRGYGLRVTYIATDQGRFLPGCWSDEEEAKVAAEE
jgi:hypothetical protein